MITLLHGDNVEASRNEFNRLKTIARGQEIRELKGENLEETLLVQALESNSILAPDKLIVIENLLSKMAKKVKLLEKLLQRFQESAGEAEIMLWEDRMIEPTVLKKFKSQVNIRLFKLPVIIFQILDGLKPNCARTLLPCLSQYTQANPPEIIFTMLVRRIRELMMLKDGIRPERLQDWQAARLTNQAKSFTLEKLLCLEQNLLEIEFNLKTGNTPFTLEQSLEQFIINL